jgi:carbon storage regulator
MLVLSRHRDEKVMLGDDIVITIVDIRGDKVRLGIEAPAGVPVHRQEVYDAIKRKEAGEPPIVAEAVTDVKPKTLGDYVKRSKPTEAATDSPE